MFGRSSCWSLHPWKFYVKFLKFIFHRNVSNSLISYSYPFFSWKLFLVKGTNRKSLICYTSVCKDFFESSLFCHVVNLACTYVHFLCQSANSGLKMLPNSENINIYFFLNILVNYQICINWFITVKFHFLYEISCSHFF